MTIPRLKNHSLLVAIKSLKSFFFIFYIFKYCSLNYYWKSQNRVEYSTQISWKNLSTDWITNNPVSKSYLTHLDLSFKLFFEMWLITNINHVDILERNKFREKESYFRTFGEQTLKYIQHFLPSIINISQHQMRLETRWQTHLLSCFVGNAKSM